jgi:type IV conjugative transfer system protein TraE
MKAKTLVNAFNQTIAQRNRLLLVVGVSALLNVLLGMSTFFMIGKERVIVVPPVVSHEFWIASDSVSDSYLEQMSEFFSGLVLNVTPSSFSSRSEQLLQHVDPSTYALVKAQLVEQGTEVARRAMSTNFHPVSFKIDRKNLIVEVKGDLKILIGNSPIETMSKNYQIQFSHRNGRIYIREFKEVQHV